MKMLIRPYFDQNDKVKRTLFWSEWKCN